MSDDPDPPSESGVLPTLEQALSDQNESPPFNLGPTDSAVSDSEMLTATTSGVATATTPIPLAATIGLIMPNPWQPLYVGLNYSFGFVDAVARPAPTISGWIRQVQPLLIFPNYTVDVFSSSGVAEPGNAEAIPAGSNGLCGATVENSPVQYPFIFQTSGWYMFVINQTLALPTVTNNTCQLPIISQQSFFASQTLSIAPLPTTSPRPVSPSSPYTVFAEVVTSTPSSLPVDAQPTSGKQKIAVGLGVAGAILGIVTIFAVVWWVKKKHRMEGEALAFSRLSERDKAALLAENPQSWLNPANSRKRQRTFPYSTGPPGVPGTSGYPQWYQYQLGARQRGNAIPGQVQAMIPGRVGPGWQGYPGYPQGVPLPLMGQHGIYKGF